jgi:hypothetical protein
MRDGDLRYGRQAHPGTLALALPEHAVDGHGPFGKTKGKSRRVFDTSVHPHYKAPIFRGALPASKPRNFREIA